MMIAFGPGGMSTGLLYRHRPVRHSSSTTWVVAARALNDDCGAGATGTVIAGSRSVQSTCSAGARP